MTELAPLQIEGLTKRFDDVVAVNGVDLRLEPGELLALVGPSGCGKSTLLRSIAGLHPIDSGSIRIKGVLVDDGHSRLPPERRATGLVFQEHALFPHLTVWDNVAFGVRDLDRSATRTRVGSMLELVELSAHGDRFPHELSGGERQRVALARALAPNPDLMLFDEPFASLDYNLRVQLRVAVVEALRATNTAAVFVTHHQSEALAIGDRIAVMRAGKICQVGTAEDVFHLPTDRFVAAFMGTASFLTMTPGDGGACSALGPVDTGGRPVDADVAMVRPDDLIFDRDPNGMARVVAREYHGNGWLATAELVAKETDSASVHSEIHSTDIIRFTTSHLDPLTIGTRVNISLAPGHRQVMLADSG